MRTAIALTLGLLLAAPAGASENDRLRGGGGGRRGGGTADGPSRSGGGSGDGCAAACDLLVTCLDLVNACSMCADAATPGPTRVIAVAPAPGPAPVVASDTGPVRFGFSVSLGRPLTEVVSVTPRADVYLDLPIDRHLAIRLEADHISLLQQEANLSWDHIPFTGLHGGLSWTFTNWALAFVGGMRALDLGVDGNSELDLAFDAGVTLQVGQEPWFVEGGLYGLAFAEMVAGEAALKAGLASGPWRLGVGWRHLEFFRDPDDGIRYSGPEISAGMWF